MGDWVPHPSTSGAPCPVRGTVQPQNEDGPIAEHQADGVRCAGGELAPDWNVR